MLGYWLAVAVRAASRMVGCCMGVTAARTVLYVVGYYTSVTVVTMLHATLGMLSQVGC